MSSTSFDFPFAKYKLRSQKWGVLGGGQLAQMLINAAADLNRPLIPLVHNADDPAALAAPDLAVISPVQSKSEFSNFFNSVDAVIFENEFVDIKQLKAAAPADLSFFKPELSTLGFLRDKLTQKKVLSRLNIPTAPFIEGPEVLSPDSALKDSEIESWLNLPLKNFGDDFILKWSLYGYDGKGTFFYRPQKHQAALDFVRSAYKKSARIYAEKKISFDRELALVSAAKSNSSNSKALRENGHGDCVHFPLVISEQWNGICHRVYGPALKFGVSIELQHQAEKAAKALAQELSISGTFAIEFFYSKQGELLVNELAPRVHNSGHFSQDASDLSQFHLHLLGSDGQNLSTPNCRPYFGMINLLGAPGTQYKRVSADLPIELCKAPNAHSFIHWYGKKEIKEGRKLGHLNTWAESESELLTSLAALDTWQKNIIEFLNKESV